MGKKIAIDGEERSGPTQDADLDRKCKYYLIRMTAPLVAQQRAEFAEAGARLLDYVALRTFLVAYRADDPERLRDFEFIEWVRDFEPRLKVSSDLELLPPEGGDVEVAFHEGVAAITMVERVARIAGTDPSALKGVAYDKIRLNTNREVGLKIAELDEVRSLERSHEAGSSNHRAGVVTGAFRVHDEVQVTGVGQIVCICDTGFDRGSTTDVHPAFTGKILAIHRMGKNKKGNDPVGHGTHIAGSIVGDGETREAGDGGGGRLPVRGTAPDASLIVQATYRNKDEKFHWVPSHLRELFNPPYEAGARVHNNSWGYYGMPNTYIRACWELDEFVAEKRHFVIVFAVGNEGTDDDEDGRSDDATVIPPATAKNCISVGATENDRPQKGRAYTSVKAWRRRFRTPPIANDRNWSDNPDGVAPFSSRGPTKDGRIKPDVVAPGTAILSALSRDTQKRLIPKQFGESIDPMYAYLCGTSSSAAFVSGCAAVIRDFLDSNPSAALVKAMLINGAVDVAGKYTPSEAPRIPNNSEGWGRVDLRNTIRPDPPARVVRFDEDRALDQGEEESHELVCTQPGEPIKVTLVWTDPPGAELVNLLVPRLEFDGKSIRSSIPADPPGTFTLADRNNVQQICLRALPAGPFQVRVEGVAVNKPRQPYALVVRGAMRRA